MKVTPVLVTRGDVDLKEILKSIRNVEGVLSGIDVEFVNLLIWDNSKLLNLGPYGQYVAATTNPDCADLVYFQDDDCVTDPAQIVAQWEPGKIVCNMSAEYRKNYEEQPDKLMGFGSVFERALIKPTFDRLQKVHADVMSMVWREPSRIFTGLNQERIKLVDVPVRHLPWATAPNRLYKQSNHIACAEYARELVAEVLTFEKRYGAEPEALAPELSPADK